VEMPACAGADEWGAGAIDYLADRNSPAEVGIEALP
jgi:hypothetical protein